ncbi:MAG TPA: beta-ketoacyl-ACP synthase II [Nitrospiria bacterium]|nr:beta-ketoacyl-ACP synthase II [Nitrospiria bacterium]
MERQIPKRRVVVTGVGLVTPLGIGVEKTWEALIAGKSGAGKITRFDASDYPVQIAAEVKDFDPALYIEKKEIKKMDTFIHFALAASQMAVDDAGIKFTEEIKDRVGVYVGAGMGGLPAIESNFMTLLEKGPRKVTPFFIPMTIINLAPGQISIRFGLRGPNTSAVTACATGNTCIGDAFRMIQRGDVDAMIAGGAESTVCRLAIAGFAASRALSTRNDDPERASRPFDRDRDGFLLGEGAGILILEELEFARNRGARIYAELVGYGTTSDAYHITSPPEDGRGAVRCMQLALKDGEVSPDEIEYINAHATSTFADKVETVAIKTTFGERARQIPVSSTKSMTGHLLGAAGGAEAVFTLLAMDRGIIPPTINLENPDPECDLDYVPNKARAKHFSCALSNSFGFGGTNASLVFKKLAKH